MIKNMFSIFIFCCIIFFGNSGNAGAVQKTPGVKIKDGDAFIMIKGGNYQLDIDKIKRIARLTNQSGAFYTSFPIHAQFAASTYNESSYRSQWQVKNDEITLTILLNELIHQKVLIKPANDAIEFKFGIKFTTADTGVFIFKNGIVGFDTDSLVTTFSPEADDYNSSTPAIDVRVDSDQQWAFTPAPLNLSFKSNAGWFSVGLAQLPDASIYAFRENAIYLNYSWNKVISSAADLHWLEPLVFTFNESSWDAIGDFRKYLESHDCITRKVKNKKSSPIWWRQPIVNTWGEQLIENIKFDSDGFNSDWVRNYVMSQEVALDSITFTLVIDDKWNRAYSDPKPSVRFKDMRQLIDWCHERGHKVILGWKAWQIEARSLAALLQIGDGEYIDATHPTFEAYIDTCCQIMLGNGENQLDADGLKLDNLFAVRNPVQATYANPALGMGMKELHHYLELLYKYAKKYKQDALISGTAIDPHFEHVQDMVRINTNWDSKFRREKRARIILQSLPDMLIDGDAANMYNSIALYHYATSAIYGIPSIHYLTSFHDDFISEATRQMIADVVYLYLLKPKGKIQFVNYGNWRIVDDNEILAESLIQGKGIVVYKSNKEGILLCTENSSVHLVLNKRAIKSVNDQQGTKIEFKHCGEGIYELINVKKGEIYHISLKKRLNFYE